ncbi:MAG: class F sortase [Candidatus Doudnabacteria bacterium]
MPFFPFAVSTLLVLTLIVSAVSYGFSKALAIPAPVVFVAEKAANPVQASVLAVPAPAIQVAVAQNLPQKKVVVIPKTAELPEAHLKIPSINVDAVIKDMGVTTTTGAMALPGNRFDVGWYDLGTVPGQTGSAVIGGHNYWDSGTGAFVNLNKLKKGDVLSVVDARGVSTSFVVSDIRTFDANDTNSGIFQSVSGVHLNLITCSGTWDPSTKSYTTRLVVYTDAV